MGNESRTTESRLHPKPRLGMALSGGGARGLAHIGVLKVLEHEGISVDCLAGTSMGGLIAAAYAIGMSAADLAQEARRMAKARRLLALADPSLLRRGLFHGQRIMEYLASLLGDRTFDDLRIPVSLVAVDLNSQQQVILSQGRVVDAVRATIAIPGIFAPLERDNQLLVDGGVLNNLPTDVVRGMNADVVIAVDVHAVASAGLFTKSGECRRTPGGPAETLDILWRSLNLMLVEIERFRLAQAPPDVLICPAIPEDVNAFTSFARAEEIIAAGERAAEAALPEIRARILSKR